MEATDWSLRNEIKSWYGLRDLLGTMDQTRKNLKLKRWCQLKWWCGVVVRTLKWLLANDQNDMTMLIAGPCVVSRFRVSQEQIDWLMNNSSTKTQVVEIINQVNYYYFPANATLIISPIKILSHNIFLNEINNIKVRIITIQIPQLARPSKTVNILFSLWIKLYDGNPPCEF